MRDRAFGVEIECGYEREEYRDCDCECTCYTCDFCESGCQESLGPDEECNCNCECEECSLCQYGCEENHGSYGCEVATTLLANNGFDDWLDDIHEDGSGVEIPSPILRGTEGLRQLRAVMELLRTNGFSTGSGDGLHVHHDAPEFVDDDTLTARLIELWEENLPVIDRFVSPLRRGGTYLMCDSYRSTYRAQQWASFKRSKSLGDLGLDKFRSLNVTPLRHYGTIEFRLHEGTLDFDQASAWIHFGQSMLEMAKRRRTIITCAEPLDLLRAARVSKRSTEQLLAKAGA
ncbi:MAG: amidoligase family protein [Patescibacteria group bacterium]|nr:amidoligase family protein [Patescibacteria group bacterium]